MNLKKIEKIKNINGKNMKLKEFLENLNTLVEKNPEALELIIVTSSDDEGNDFNEVYYEPSIGHYQKEASKGSFVSLKEFQEWGLTESDVNSVCIN